MVRDEGEHEALAQLTTALWAFWRFRGHFDEAASRYATALKLSHNVPAGRAGSSPSGSRLDCSSAQLVHDNGALAIAVDDYAQAQRYLEESLELAEAGGDDLVAGKARSDLGILALYEHRDDDAAASFAASLEIGPAGAPSSLSACAASRPRPP